VPPQFVQHFGVIGFQLRWRPLLVLQDAKRIGAGIDLLGKIARLFHRVVRVPLRSMLLGRDQNQITEAVRPYRPLLIGEVLLPLTFVIRILRQHVFDRKRVDRDAVGVALIEGPKKGSMLNLCDQSLGHLNGRKRRYLRFELKLSHPLRILLQVKRPGAGQIVVAAA